ncbi:hypothetical protein MMPV_009105 [Pyropia vietnamensis]
MPEGLPFVHGHVSASDGSGGSTRATSPSGAAADSAAAGSAAPTPDRLAVVPSVAGLAAARAALPATARVGLVATMGALHEGHLALVRRSLAETDVTIVSIYVNPLQFGPTEDLATYPRTLDADMALLTPVLCGAPPVPPTPPLGRHLIFTPSVSDLRPSLAGTTVTTTVGEAAVNPTSEGAARPHFFAGVATVVTSLLVLARPTAAYFGEKDAQQLAVVRALARDLHFPTTIVGVPTVRAADGLAESSRNVYLTPADRAAAPVLYRALCAGRDAWAGAGGGGVVSGATLRATVTEVLEKGVTAAGGRVLYVSVADRWTMREVEGDLRPPAVVAAEAPLGEVVICVAAQLGNARLIDNIVLR